MSEDLCIHCGRPAARAGLCWAHVKRAQRGQDLDAPIAGRSTEDAFTRLSDAALAYSDAMDGDDDQAVRETTRKLQRAARRYRGKESADV